MTRRFAIVQTLLFVVAIWMPLTANIVGGDGADPMAENRELATPDDGLFRWFEDHFGFRSTLVSANARLTHFAIRPLRAGAVVRGEDGWLFYGEDGTIEDYVNAEPLGPAGVRAWRDTIVGARDFLRARGIGYLFTIAPDKHVIYPEHFPDSIRPVGTFSRTDQVFDALADSGVSVDVRPALWAAKGRERLYHLTDTHWNTRGVLPAYQAIIAAARLQVPDIPPAWTRSDFEAKTRRLPGMDLAGMIGLKRVLWEDDLVLLPRRPRRATVVEPRGAGPTDELGRLVTEIAGSSLPRAVVVRDSFASAMVPFLSEHFSRAVYLWQNDLIGSQLLAERPDIVIHEIVGRHLYTFYPTPDLIGK